MAYKLKAALRTTIVPDIGPLPTSFTRNLAAYVSDFEGLLKLVPANCARFGGARFVQNVANASITNTDSIAGSISTPNGVGTVNGAVAPTVPAAPQEAWAGPDGVVMQVTRCVLNLNGGTTTNDRAWIDLRGVGALSLNGRSGRSSLWARAVSGSPTVQYRHGSGTSTFQLGQAWQRVSVNNPVSNGDGTHVIGLRGGVVPATSDSADIIICRLLLEETTGQSNTNPSEYVPVRTGLAFPYKGTGADGCQFFDYLNGNTVDANGIVTEAHGAAIAAATLKRYRKEKAATNYAVQSSAFNTWTQRNGHVVTADAATAPDGSLTADLVTVTGVALVNQGVYTENVAAGNTQYAGTLWLKAGAGVTSVRLILKDRASDTVRSSRSVPMTAGWAQCPAVNAVTAGATTGYRFEFEAEQNGTFYVWQGQVEPGFVGTSPIPTTGAAVARPEDLLVWPVSVFSDAQGTCYATAEPDDWTQTNNARVIGAGTTGESGTSLFTSNGRFGTYDGSVAVQSPLISGATGKLAGAATWSAATGTKRAFIGGAASAPGAYDGSYGLTGVGLGMGGNIPFQGYIGDVVILDTALSEFAVPHLPDYVYPRLITPGATGAVLPRPTIGAVRPSPAIAGATNTSTIRGIVQ